MSLPSANVIPDKLINAKVYLEGSSALLGMADIELPSLEYVTESMSGLGIAGELDTPTLGHFKGITLKFKWNTVNANAVAYWPRRRISSTSGQRAKVRRRERRVRHRRREARGRTVPKKFGVGKAEPGKKMDSETEMEVNYLSCLGREGTY